MVIKHKPAKDYSSEYALVTCSRCGVHRYVQAKLYPTLPTTCIKCDKLLSNS